MPEEDANDFMDLKLHIVQIEAGIEAIRSDTARFVAAHQDHEQRLRRVETKALDCGHELDEVERRIDKVEQKVDAWGWTNGALAAIAGMIGWFRP